MATTVGVSLDEYLNTSYEPDVEFVDGVLVARNVGTGIHSWLESRLVLYFGQFEDSHQIGVLVEVRLRIGARRHRIPDVTVLERPFSLTKTITDVPIITIEVKSPEDTFDDIVEKCLEYEAMGVRNILVMDPDHRRAWLFEQNNLRLLTGESLTLQLTHTTLDLPFSELFAKLPKA